MKNIFILLFFTPSFIFGQEVLSISSYERSSDLEKALLNSSFSIKENETLNHELVDLVNAFTIDSAFTRKFERHQVIGGGVIRLLGYRWKAVDQTRKKFVGWVNRHYLHDEDEKAQFTEYDINYDLIPLLPQYIQLSYETYQAQFKMKKSKKGHLESKAPYIYPTEEEDMTKYRFHCENTPSTNFRSLLNTKFFPVHRKNDLKVHPNFEDENPVMGMYGVLVLDCNHSCHPEIHPYEWIWWMNLTKEYPSWNVGFIRDISSRFKHWSSNPRTGEISIPFTFSTETKNWEIEVDHQLFGNFSNEGFTQLNLPQNSYNFSALERNFSFAEEQLKGINLSVVSSVKIPYQSLVYYFTDINLDEENDRVSGYFNLATSITEVYTCEVTMKQNAEKNELSELLMLMQGSFTSEVQAKQDSDYYDITLHMYPIWENEDAAWLYVEQTLTSMPGKPYRQRVYKVEQLDAETFRSEIYLIPDEDSAIGQWNNLSYFNQFTEKDLIKKEGCAVFLKKTSKGNYEGSTLGANCISNYRGAKFATSKVIISKVGISSWDQGFNSSHLQIWGAEKGPYFFKK